MSIILISKFPIEGIGLFVDISWVGPLQSSVSFNLINCSNTKMLNWIDIANHFNHFLLLHDLDCWFISILKHFKIFWKIFRKVSAIGNFSDYSTLNLIGDDSQRKNFKGLLMIFILFLLQVIIRFPVMSPIPSKSIHFTMIKQN